MIDFSTKTDEKALISKLGELRVLKERKKILTASLGEVSKEHSELSEEVYTLMENDDIQSMTVGGRNYHRRLDRYIGFKDKVVGFEWLKEVALDDLIQPAVNSQTLTAEIKRMESEGFEVPTDNLNERTVRRIGDTKA